MLPPSTGTRCHLPSMMGCSPSTTRPASFMTWANSSRGSIAGAWRTWFSGSHFCSFSRSAPGCAYQHLVCLSKPMAGRPLCSLPATCLASSRCSYGTANQVFSLATLVLLCSLRASLFSSSAIRRCISGSFRASATSAFFRSSLAAEMSSSVLFGFCRTCASRSRACSTACCISSA